MYDFHNKYINELRQGNIVNGFGSGVVLIQQLSLENGYVNCQSKPECRTKCTKFVNDLLILLLFI